MSAGAVAAAARHIWLCADDYGLSPGVNRAICQLIERGRLNATSVMVLPPSFDRNAVAALQALKARNNAIAIGLHLTLTAPFKPLTGRFAPVSGGSFLPVKQALRAALLRRYDADALGAEIRAQLRAFAAAFGGPPDYVDGHQHVQLFPQVRDAVLAAMAERAPRAWLRQCGGNGPWLRRLGDRKGLLIDVLSVAVRRKARRLGIAVNPAFAGTYDFTANADFSRIFPGFLDNLPRDGLVMCHPGFVDDELKRLDPLTTLRQREYDYFAADNFPAMLAARGVTLA